MTNVHIKDMFPQGVEEYLANLPKYVRCVEENGIKWIEINKDGKFDQGFTYDIPLDDIKTAKAMVRWIFHLTEKTWVNGEIINQLIGVICDELKINPHMYF